MKRYPDGSSFLTACLFGTLVLMIAAGTLAACVMMTGGNLGRVNLPLLALAAVVAFGSATTAFYRFATYRGGDK